MCRLRSSDVPGSFQARLLAILRELFSINDDYDDDRSSDHRGWNRVNNSTSNNHADAVASTDFGSVVVVGDSDKLG